MLSQMRFGTAYTLLLSAKKTRKELLHRDKGVKAYLGVRRVWSRR